MLMTAILFTPLLLDFASLFTYRELPPEGRTFPKGGIRSRPMHAFILVLCCAVLCFALLRPFDILRALRVRPLSFQASYGGGDYSAVSPTY